jgi:sec-independent protein translocase protein TatA
MLGLGPTELVIILVIIVIVFGVGRISKIGGELGSGIKAFKEGLGGDEEKEAEAEAETETETETETEEK